MSRSGWHDRCRTLEWRARGKVDAEMTNTMRFTQTPAMHITLLLAEHSSQASATLALEVLDAANRLAAPSAVPFAVVVASLDGLPVKNAPAVRWPWTSPSTRSITPIWYSFPVFCSACARRCRLRPISRLAVPPASAGRLHRVDVHFTFMLASGAARRRAGHHPLGLRRPHAPALSGGTLTNDASSARTAG